MSYKMNTVKNKMIEALLNNTVDSCETAYNLIVDSMHITLSTKEKARIISEVVNTIIHC